MTPIHDAYLSIVWHPLSWIFVGLTLTFFLIQSLTANSGTPPRTADDRLQGLAKSVGLGGLPPVLFLFVGLTWLVVALTLLFGLYRFIWMMVWQTAPTGNEELWAWRFGLAQIAALTTVLGAVIALPLTMARLLLTRRQTETSEQGHITDRINTAVEGLGAEKEFNRIGRPITIWSGESRTTTHLVDNYKDWQLPPRSVEKKRYREKTEMPDGELFVGLHIEIEIWPAERTVIQWQGQPPAIEETEYFGEYGDWKVFTETSPNLEVRIGAIYALERIAQDSDRDHVQIMEILCAYIRQNAPAPQTDDWPRLEIKESEDNGPLDADWKERRDAFNEAQENAKAGLKLREDIQVALTVLGRRRPEQRLLEARAGEAGEDTELVFDLPCPDYDGPEDSHDPAALDTYLKTLGDWKRTLLGYEGYRLDLRNADLRGADLSGLNLNGAKLTGTFLQGADLWGARLQEAEIREVRLQGADLEEVRLQGADLEEARLQGANLGLARLQGANLADARLQGAVFWSARLQGVDLAEARLQGAELRRAQLQGADLWSARLQGTNLAEAQLQGTELAGARFDAQTNLTAAALRGAAVRFVDCTEVPQIAEHLEDMYGDGSVKPPEGVAWPGHWPGHVLEGVAVTEDGAKLGRFIYEWRKWQADPETYAPPDPPKEADEG